MPYNNSTLGNLMHKKEIIYGFIFGAIGVLLGVFLFDLGVGIYKGTTFSRLLNHTFSTILLDKRASIGALLNLPLFYFFLHKKKDNYAKGVLFATIVVALIFLINKL